MTHGIKTAVAAGSGISNLDFCNARLIHVGERECTRRRLRTGWFTHRMAQLPSLRVVGIDTDSERLDFARERDSSSTYILADARRIPFPDRYFDLSISVTALCFIPDWPVALNEILRVTRRRFAVGLLNRNSLLWHDKGRDGGMGAYSGAHWHSIRELRLELARMAVQHVRGLYMNFPSWHLWVQPFVLGLTGGSGSFYQLSLKLRLAKPGSWGESLDCLNHSR